MIKNELKWELQLFPGEGEGDGSGGNGAGEGEGNGEGNGGSNEGGGGFDDFLKDPSNQSEFDKRVAKALETQKTKLEADYKKSIDDAKKEAEKLAKMNADQKKDYEFEKVKAENDRLKAEAAKVELGREATSILKEHEIDATQDILDFVVGSDADSTKANIDRFVEIINSQVKAAEVKRATGRTPKDYGTGGEYKSKDEIMKIKDPEKRQAAIAKNMGLFRKG